MAIKLPHAKSVAKNPTQAEMREWALQYMPRIIETEFGNLSYKALIKARLSRSTSRSCTLLWAVASTTTLFEPRRAMRDFNGLNASMAAAPPCACRVARS